jgi:uncharacterized Rossmann fold enzyme
MRREYDFHALVHERVVNVVGGDASFQQVVEHATAGIVFGREGAHSALNVVAVPFR